MRSTSEHDSKVWVWNDDDLSSPDFYPNEWTSYANLIDAALAGMTDDQPHYSVTLAAIIAESPNIPGDKDPYIEARATTKMLGGIHYDDILMYSTCMDYDLIVMHI